MKLYFENSQGRRRLLGVYETEKDAVRHICRFCDEHNFIIHYMRFVDSTNDSTCPFWTEIAVVNIGNKDYYNAHKEIEDCISSYFDSSASEDKPYDEVVADILNSFKFKWQEYSGRATIEFCFVFHI